MLAYLHVQLVLATLHARLPTCSANYSSPYMLTTLLIILPTYMFSYLLATLHAHHPIHHPTCSPPYSSPYMLTTLLIILPTYMFSYLLVRLLASLLHDLLHSMLHTYFIAHAN